jgi:hypothetical protein
VVWQVDTKPAATPATPAPPAPAGTPAAPGAPAPAAHAAPDAEMGEEMDPELALALQLSMQDAEPDKARSLLCNLQAVGCLVGSLCVYVS